MRRGQHDVAGTATRIPTYTDLSRGFRDADPPGTDGCNSD